MADNWQSQLEAMATTKAAPSADWKASLESMAGNEPAKPFDAPFMPELRAAADQQQTAMDNADELPFRVTSTISGAYGALDRVLNIPNYSMQATLPASQRKPINLQADFESVVPIAAQMRAKYPQAYAQRANFAGMAAPVPAVGKGKDLLGTVLKQGAAGAAYGVAGVPDEALKHKQDITLPMLGKAAAIGAGFGSVLGAGLHGLEKLMAGRQQAIAQGADDVAMTSNVDASDVDESLLAALGLIKQQKPEALKPNVMATATARPDFLKGGVTLNQYQAQTAKMLSRAEPYVKQPNAFDAVTARPIFATPKMEADRLDAFMKGTMREAEARVQAIRKAQAQEAASAQSAKKQAEEIRAKLDSQKQAEEALDAAVNYPLSFKKFKDNGITWTPAGLSDEKLHQYAETLAKQASTASGGAKRAAAARAEAINQEIARRQALRNEGVEPTVPDKVPTQPTQEVPKLPAERKPAMSTQELSEYDAKRHARAYEPLEYQLKNFGKSKQREAGSVYDATGVQAQDLTDSQLEAHWQELSIQIRMPRVTPSVEKKLGRQQIIIDAEQMRRSDHRFNGWRENWTQEDGINYSRLSDEELHAHIASGDEQRALHAIKELDAREVPGVSAQELSNNDIREIQHKLAVEEFVPSQLEEAVQLADVVNKEAQARNLLPSVIGAERALEGVPLQVAVQKGQITPEFAQRVQEIADAAYAAKRLEMQTDLLREAIVGNGKTDVKVGKLTFKAKRDYSSEHDISRNREAGEAIESARKGKDVEVGQRAGHLRAIVGDGGTNLALREAVRQEMGARLQQPIEAMAADWQALHKALTSTAKAAPGARDVSKRLRGAAYSEFEALKQLHSKPDNMWSLNTVVDTLPDGTKVRCGIECVTEHAIKQFSDEAKAADMQKVIQAQLDSNNAWLKKPGVTLTPNNKALILVGMTALESLHAHAVYAASHGAPLLDAATVWAGMGGTAQGLIAALFSGIGPVGHRMARSILEGGALGRIKLPTRLWLGRDIALADNYRNTVARVAALNKLVPDEFGNLAYQKALTGEHFRLSRQLEGVNEDVAATAMYELKNELVTPEGAVAGQRTWGKLTESQREAVLRQRVLSNAAGNRLRKYIEVVDEYQKGLRQIMATGTPGQAAEAERRLELIEALTPSLKYMDEALNPTGQKQGYLEKGGSQLVANFNQNAFGQKNWAFQMTTFADQFVLATSYVGAEHMHVAQLDRLADGELRGLLKSFRFVGERAGDVQESVINANFKDRRGVLGRINKAVDSTVGFIGHAIPSYDRERVNAEELALAVVYRHYDKNRKLYGSIGRKEYAKRVLEAKGLPAETVLDAWNEIVTALDEVHAVSPFNLNTNILNESKSLAQLIGWFAKQPAREARLLMVYASKGDWRAISTFYLWKTLIAGSVAIPVELRFLFQLTDGAGARELSDKMDSMSIYNAIDSEGTMSPKMEHAHAWWTMAGRQAPVQAMGESLVRFIENKVKQMNEEGELTFTGEDALTVANGALPAIPGGKRLPIRPMLSTANAYMETQGKAIKAYPKFFLAPASMAPEFNKKQETTVQEQGYDPLTHILRAPIAPGVLKYKHKVNQESQAEEYDALAQFFANKVLKK